MSELIRHTVAIDPSVNSTGVALFFGRDLIRTARVVGPARPDGMSAKDARWAGARIYTMGDAVFDFLAPWLHPKDVTNVIYERPQIYAPGTSKGDNNDLLALPAVAHHVAALLRPLEIVAPTPREWSQGTSKTTRGNPWKCSRGIMLNRRLTPTERALVPAQHDIIDAVCIGLWFLKRFEPIRKFPGAT